MANCCHRPFSINKWSGVIFVVTFHSILLSSVSSYKYKSFQNEEPNSFEFVTKKENIQNPPQFEFDSSERENIVGKNNFEKNVHNQRLDRYPEEDNRFKQWNSVDNEQPHKEDKPVWSSSSSSVDDEKSKTLPFPSLPTLDIVEDPGYSYNHGHRPTWPLSEYLSDKFNNFYTRTNKTKSHHHHQSTNSNYEWQQLKPSPHFGSSTSASHQNYDTKYFSLDDDNYSSSKDRYRDNNNHNYRIYNGHIYDNSHGHAHRYNTNNNNDIRGQQSGTHTTTVSTTTDIQKGGSSTSTNTETTNRGVTKLGPYGGYGWGPHHGAHYFPPDHYPKKRFRLKIHPGYIAAPLAGLAAFGAASALTNKPLLFELGLVNNKYRYAHGHQYPHNYNYPHPHDLHYPGHGWASNTVPTIYPPVNPPIFTSGSPLTPQYPILKPDEYGHGHHHGLHGHHHHHHHGHYQPEPDKKPWWNPFSALTPRD